MGHSTRHCLTDALCAIRLDRSFAGVSDTFACFLKRQVASELASRMLIALRDTPLAKLLSGEFRLTEAETVMEAKA